MISRAVIAFELGILVLTGGVISGQERILSLRENIRIGDGGKLPDVIFSRIRAIQADDSGRIYVLDDRDVLVKVFDAQGRPLLSFGKRGQGPGDLQSPFGMTLSGGVLSIFDFSNKRISRFDLNGNLIEELDLRAAGSFFRTEAEAPGVVFGNALDFEEDGSQILRLVRFGIADHSVRVIAEYRLKSSLSARNPLEGTYHLRGLPDGRFAWIHEGEYALNVISADGAFELRRTRDLHPARVTKEDREMLIKVIYGGKDSVPPELTLVWPKFYPPLRSLVTTDNGWIILRTNAKDDRGRNQYDVFDAGCDFLGSFHHDGRESLHAVKSGMAYFAAESEQRFLIVKRYEIVR